MEELKNSKFQLSISNIMPARPKNKGTWGVNMTIPFRIQGQGHSYGNTYYLINHVFRELELIIMKKLQ